MNDLLNSIIEKMPFGAIVLDRNCNIIFANTYGKLFLRRHRSPDEFTTLSNRIFDSIDNGTFIKIFPGEIYLYKKLEGSSSRWVFKFDVSQESDPRVYIFIREESVADKLNLNELRLKFRLTRREVDVLRRTLRGLQNTETAEELNISEQTVKDYLSSIYLKLEVKNKFELVSSLLNFPEQNAGDSTSGNQTE
jgi:DNA-binding CsgD family transcriptional regulator